MDPERLGKYELRRVLGKGAMGTVYEGWDPIIERTLMASSTEPGLVADTFTVRYWTERELDGTWHEAPGGTLDLWGRSGRLVAIHSTSGEYVGDPHEEAAADLPPAQVLADLLAMA